MADFIASSFKKNSIAKFLFFLIAICTAQNFAMADQSVHQCLNLFQNDNAPDSSLTAAQIVARENTRTGLTARPTVQSKLTEAINVRWQEWLNIVSGYSMGNKSNRELIESLESRNPEFYQFLKFVAPEFPARWPDFDSLQSRYVAYQIQSGIPRAKVFHLGLMNVNTASKERKKGKRRAVSFSTRFIDPSHIHSSFRHLDHEIHTEPYYRALASRIVPVKFLPTIIPVLDNFPILHDLAHAYGMAQPRFSRAVFKWLPGALEEVIANPEYWGDGKSFKIVSAFLEDYWELRSHDWVQFKRQMQIIDPIMSKIRFALQTAVEQKRESTKLLRPEEAELLKAAFAHLSQIVRSATIRAFGAAPGEGIAINRWNYEIDYYKNPNDFFQYVQEDAFFSKVASERDLSSLQHDLEYFDRFYYHVAVELLNRSLDQHH